MVLEAHYTLKEVASRLRVSVRTVQRWIQEGRLHAVELPSGKYGKPGVRIPVSALRDVGFSIVDKDEPWDKLFSEHPDVLERLADEAEIEIKAGRTKELDPDLL